MNKQSFHLPEKLKTATRFKIVGVEVVGSGIFLILILGLELREGGSNSLIRSFGWDYLIAGVTLILIGLEILSLIKNLPVSQDKIQRTEA
jgi:hypothetical protein